RQINNPIQPGAEQILLPGLLSLPRPHRHPPSIISRARNHSLRFEGIAKTICKKAAAPPPNSGKNHYLERLNHPSRSTPWKYFTGDETLHGLAKHHDISRHLIRIWVKKLEA